MSYEQVLCCCGQLISGLKEGDMFFNAITARLFRLWFINVLFMPLFHGMIKNQYKFCIKNFFILYICMYIDIIYLHYTCKQIYVCIYKFLYQIRSVVLLYHIQFM